MLLAGACLEVVMLLYTAVMPLYFHKYYIFFKKYIDYDLNVYEMVILHKQNALYS